MTDYASTMDKNPRNWTDEDICFQFDMYQDTTLDQLSRMTGKSVAQLKRILMS